MPQGPADQRALLLRTPLADGDYQVGTGTLIAERLALTAAHVVFGDDGAPLEGIRVGPVAGTGPPDWNGLVDAEVAWPGQYTPSPMPGRVLDVALVKITDPAWEKPKGLSERVRLGTLTGRAGGVVVEAIGYPRALRGEDGERVADQVSATINPSGARDIGRYDLSITSSHSSEAGGWGGLSGAGVFVNGLLIAVVVVDARGFDHSRLPAIPVSRLVQVEGARKILRDHGFDYRLQSAELADLISMGPLQERYRSPAALLRPEARIVKLFGREAVMTQLANWCVDATHLIDIALITGPGGQGKTRLAQELVRDRGEHGWVAGFLRSDLIDAGYPGYDFSPIADTASHVPGVLLVADYANTRPKQLIRLLTILAKTDDLAPVRLLLLARSSGEWWNELRRSHFNILEHAIQIPLGGIGMAHRIGNEDFGAVGGISGEAFKTAVSSYAADDALPSIFPGYDWSSIADGIAPPDDIEDLSYGSPLTLQLSALTALLRHAQIIPDGQFGSPEDQLLNHEDSYWGTSADAAGLPFSAGYQRRWLSYFVAAANLFGARTEAEAVRLMGRLQVGSGDHAVVRGIAKWLHELYPPNDGREYWGSLQPDRLAEHHLGALAGEQGDLLQMLFWNAEPEEASRAVPLITRAARQHEVLIGQLADLLQAVDLPCRAALIPVMQEVALPQRRSPANLDPSRQYLNYALTPASARGAGSSQANLLIGPLPWQPNLAIDLTLQRGGEL